MNNVVRAAIRVFSGLILLLLLLGTFIGWKGGHRLATSYSLDYDEAFIPGDSLSIANGEYLVAIHACSHCHATDLGGSLVADAPPFFVYASNLTSGAGGIGKTYTDADWLRAIRHGVRPDGTGLYVMPSEVFYELSDEEVGDMVAYLKTIPAVDREHAPTEIKLMGKLIAGVDQSFASTAELVPIRARMAMPERAPTAEYGAYRVRPFCIACHGEDLGGGIPPNPDSPPAPDLHPYASQGLEAFTTTIRTGVTPSGRVLDGKFMPWTASAQMTNGDIEAIYLHLKDLAMN